MRQWGKASLLALGLAGGAQAHYIEGKVFCDTNFNGVKDSEDTALGGVTVLATHPVEGEFSGITGFSTHHYFAGRYRIDLPAKVYDDYTLSLDTSSLPADTTFVSPTSNSYVFSLPADDPFGYFEWLVQSEHCAAPVPAIELCTSVRISDDAAFSDADNSYGDRCDTLPQGVPVGVVGETDAEYQLIVTNTGPETLIDTVINAPGFGLVNVPVPAHCGDLEPGEACVIEVDDADTTYLALAQSDVCVASGEVIQTATASAVGLTSGIPVSDSDPAIVDCTNAPHISLRKEVSMNGSAFADANAVESAPVAAVGADAVYRFVVTNNGTEPLTNVVINDAELGLVDVFVSDSLAVGEVVIVDQTAAGFAPLWVANRCANAGVYLNTASVQAQGSDSGLPVSASDIAYVACEQPLIDLRKEVSINGFDYFDANTVDAADVPVGVVGQTEAFYRFVVTNLGTETLHSVQVSDERLGIDTGIADLAVGETRVIEADSRAFSELYQDLVCVEQGTITNVASVTAIGSETGVPVSAMDPANLRCIAGPQITVRKQVRLRGSDTFVDADTVADAPIGLLGADAEYRFVVANVGDEYLTSVVVSDSVLGIDAVLIDDLAVAEERVIDQFSAGFGALMAQGQCDAVGSQLNVVNVRAEGVVSGLDVSANDPAYIVCEAPVACAVTVDQKCAVATHVSDDKLCTDAISATTLRYVGPDLTGATVTLVGKDTGYAEYANIDLVSGHTILTSAAQNGYTVDAGNREKLGSKTSIFINGREEIIHTSCSAIYVAGAPAPLDGNTPYPANSEKGEPSPNWEVVSFRQKDDVVVVGASETGELSEVCEIPFAGADVSYAYEIFNQGTTDVAITSVLDDQLGEVLTTTPTLLPAGETLSLMSTPVRVNASMLNSVVVSAQVADNAAVVCPAMDSVRIEAAPAPELSCEDGKPTALQFTYVGGSCADSNNTQGDKFICSGDSSGVSPAWVEIVDKRGELLASQTMTSGNIIVIDNAGEKFESETHIHIYDGSHKVQSLNIHTSCSAPLVVGDQYGGVLLSAFTPVEDGKGGKGKKDKKDKKPKKDKKEKDGKKGKSKKDKKEKKGKKSKK